MHSGLYLLSFASLLPLALAQSQNAFINPGPGNTSDTTKALQSNAQTFQAGDNVTVKWNSSATLCSLYVKAQADSPTAGGAFLGGCREDHVNTFAWVVDLPEGAWYLKMRYSESSGVPGVGASAGYGGSFDSAVFSVKEEGTSGTSSAAGTTTTTTASTSEETSAPTSTTTTSVTSASIHSGDVPSTSTSTTPSSTTTARAPSSTASAPASSSPPDRIAQSSASTTIPQPSATITTAENTNANTSFPTKTITIIAVSAALGALACLAAALGVWCLARRRRSRRQLATGMGKEMHDQSSEFSGKDKAYVVGDKDDRPAELATGGEVARVELAGSEVGRVEMG